MNVEARGKQRGTDLRATATTSGEPVAAPALRSTTPRKYTTDRVAPQRDDDDDGSGGEDLFLKCFNCRQLIFVITRQVSKQWKLLTSASSTIPTVRSLSDLFANIAIHASLSLVNLDGRCRRCKTSMHDLRKEAFSRTIRNFIRPQQMTTSRKIPVAASSGRTSKMNDKKRYHQESPVVGLATSVNYHKVRSNVSGGDDASESCLEDFILSWNPRGTSKQLLGNNNNTSLGGAASKERNSHSMLYQTFVGATVFPLKTQLQQPQNYAYQQQQRLQGPPVSQQSIPVEYMRYQAVPSPKPMTAQLRSMQAPSSSNAASNVHRRSPYKHQHAPKQSGGKSLRGNREEVGPETQSFPTNFGRVLKECPPPVPPSLLRLPPSAPLARKDPASRLKILLRVLPSVSGGNASPDNCYLTVDSRKKQVALLEHQSQQRPSTSSLGVNGAKGALPKLFSFDSVFSADDSHTEICSNALTDVVQSVVNGSDGCVLSFGHAGSGNAHSMVGQDSGAQTLGIIPSAISWLFRLIQECKQRTGARFSIRISAIEVAGPQEELRDLLVPYATPSVTCSSDDATSAGLCLKEDPVFGTQLQNACELRVPTAEKAAFYLDAALSARCAHTEEEKRNSHLFFTLHVYQYQVDKCKKGGVAGGRTRLHLIDLGSGEKNSKAGRTSLTLPALGNVLLTLLQGQKHLPFRDSKLSQILKDAIGSQACKAITVITNVRPDQDRYMETVNAVQIAGRLCRIKRTKKTRLGVGANSSGGESSCDERAGRRRLARSASDPDCTTSSSEQSCDTVIFLGAGGAPNRRVMGGISISDKELTDSEACAPIQPTKTQGSTTMQQQHPMMGTGRTMTVSATTSPMHTRSTGAGIKPATPIHRTSHQQGFLGDSPKHQPHHWPNQSNLSVKEQWVDGPSASTTLEQWIDQPKKKDASFLDPLKHEFIKQWVFLQDQERRQEIKLDKCFQPGKGGLLTKQYVTLTERQRELDSLSVHSMETSSDQLELVETKDAALQIDEQDIDLEMGKPGDENLKADDVNCNWPTAAEPEIRFLEDIAEVEEENLSETRSHHSSLHDQIMESLNYRNEAMAHMDSNFFLNEPKGSLFARQSTSSFEEHPLRILSKERMDTKSDSFSFTSENIENISLPGTDQLEEDLPTDEELERAMQASLTSIRSHEILEKLKSEFKSKKPGELAAASKKSNTSKSERQEQVPLESSIRVQPEGVEKSVKSLEASPLKTMKVEFPVQSVSAYHSKELSGESPVKSLMSDKVQHPTIPALPKSVQNEVTSKFSAASLTASTSSRFNVKEHSTSKSALVSSVKLKSPDKAEPSAQFSSSLPRPSKLPSPTPAAPAKAQIPVHTTKESMSKLKMKNVKDMKPLKAEKTKSTKTNGVASNGAVASSSTNSDKQVGKQSAEKEKATKIKSPSISGIKSPLMNFLKSPSRAKKPIPPSPGQRSSVGYDSGHDSGIVTAESPELLSSPYSKVTKPRQSQRSSSGHGSDNSSAVSSDAGIGKTVAGKSKVVSSRLSLGFGSKSKNRESVGASSGYESAGVRESETAATSPESASDTETTLKSTPSYKFMLKKSWLEGFAMHNAKSKSAPQSPSNAGYISSPYRMCDSQVVDRNELRKHQEDLRCLKRKQKEVAVLSEKQLSLQLELKDAKDRLCIPPSKWNYELHVAQCTDMNQADFLEALRQETKILEKRVIACKSHVMMVTVFDAAPAAKKIV